jgi:hypothetical protein
VRRTQKGVPHTVAASADGATGSETHTQHRPETTSDVAVRMRTVTGVRNLPGQLSGTVSAWSVSVIALLVLLNPDPALRAGLALVVPAVVWLAFAGTTREGACPACGRRGRQPERPQPQVRAASRTENGVGGVQVRIGWAVTITDSYICGRCTHAWQVVQETFVDRGDAPTSSEAALLATARPAT